MAKDNIDLKNFSQEELKKGAVYSFVNASLLFQEASLLQHNGRNERVYGLAKLSFEEISKSLILLELSFYKQWYSDSDNFNNKVKKANSLFLSHNKKTRYGLGFLIDMIKELDKFTKVNSKNAIQRISVLKNIEIQELDQHKNESFYVDVKDNEFISPSLNYSEFETLKIMDLAKG